MKRTKLNVDHDLISNCEQKLRGCSNNDISKVNNIANETNIQSITNLINGVNEFNIATEKLSVNVSVAPDLLYNINDSFIQYDLKVKEEIEK